MNEAYYAGRFIAQQAKGNIQIMFDDREEEMWQAIRSADVAGASDGISMKQDRPY